MKKTVLFSLLFSLTFSLMLSGCAGPEERAWRSGQKALAEENYAAAAAAFEKAGSFQDAEQLLLYARASQNLESGEYRNAVSGFRELGDFKDSALMDDYCQAREQEEIAQASFASDDAEQAVTSCHEAYALYSGLALFRDSDMRAADCRDLLYEKATEWLNLGRYEAAGSGFEALGDWQDSTVLQKYCKAAELEKQEYFAEAADLYSEIPDILDSAKRADSARDQAYQAAISLVEQQDYDEALRAFTALGDYRDAEEQFVSTSVLQIRTLIQSGSYSEALKKLSLLPDPTVFPAPDAAASFNPEAYIGSFLNTWMNAHAGVMNAFFSHNLLLPYLEPEGELDRQLLAELTDDISPVNYGFIFQGADVSRLLALDENFIAAKSHGSASYAGPEGRVDAEESLWILIDTGSGVPIVSSVLPA